MGVRGSKAEKASDNNGAFLFTFLHGFIYQFLIQPSHFSTSLSASSRQFGSSMGKCLMGSSGLGLGSLQTPARKLDAEARSHTEALNSAGGVAGLSVLLFSVFAISISIPDSPAYRTHAGVVASSRLTPFLLFYPKRKILSRWFRQEGFTTRHMWLRPCHLQGGTVETRFCYGYGVWGLWV